MPSLLGIGTFRGLTRLAAFLFTFFHALGEAGFRIDESFSGITHMLELCNAQCSMHNAQCTMKVFHSAVREWFSSSFPSPTRPQQLGWPAIAAGDSTLILAPTGSGKTLAAFLWCLNRLMFTPAPPKASRCRVLYISPLKALAVDVERNLRAPLVGISNLAAAAGTPFSTPAIAIRTGDTPANERARFQRAPAEGGQFDAVRQRRSTAEPRPSMIVG